MVERINPVTVRDWVEDIYSNGSDADVVESYLRLKYQTGPPYAIKISYGSSDHTKPFGNFMVAVSRCAYRGAEVGECRYSLDLLQRL